MIERLFGRGRKNGVLLIAGAALAAVVIGPGATIAQKAMNLTTTTGDKRYIKRSELQQAGTTVEAPLKLTSTTFTPIATATIKAPGPGFVTINGSLSAKDDATAGASKLQYRLAVGTTPLSTTPQSFELFLPTSEDRMNGSVNGFAKVARKGTLEIKLEAQHAAGSTSADILGRSLTATFTPKAKAAPAKKKKPAGGNVGP